MSIFLSFLQTEDPCGEGKPDQRSLQMRTKRPKSLESRKSDKDDRVQRPLERMGLKIKDQRSLEMRKRMIEAMFSQNCKEEEYTLDTSSGLSFNVDTGEEPKYILETSSATGTNKGEAVSDLTSKINTAKKVHRSNKRKKGSKRRTEDISLESEKSDKDDSGMKPHFILEPTSSTCDTVEEVKRSNNREKMRKRRTTDISLESEKPDKDDSGGLGLCQPFKLKLDINDVD